jgi:FAD/FMN-containing dehydrogenase
MIATRTTRRTFVGLGSAALAAAAGCSVTAAPARSTARQAPPDLTGRVIRPGDPDYDAARLGFNARFSHFPVAIVVCNDTVDVQNAVRWARREGVPLRARSGGHSYEGYSTLDDGLVIDVGGLNEIAVDTARGEAAIGAGVRLGELYRRLGEHGVTIPAGTCPGVGIAGLTLGGGIGFLSRRYGLTCDNLLAVELVDANGDLLRAREDEHADLFWALRGGGGGNFGIATRFTFRVHPTADAAVFGVTWPWEDVPEVLDAWQCWAPFTDDRLTAGFVVPDPSAGVVICSGQFTGPAGEALSLLQPLLQAGSPSPPNVRALPFLDAVAEFGGAPIAHSTFKNTGAFVSALLPPEAIASFVERMRAAPTDANLVGFFPTGGAVAAADPAATAFVHRDALFDMQYQAYWHDPADAAADLAWIGDLRTAMAPHTSGGYVNYIDSDQPDWQAAYYGPNLPRLMQIKAKYDPDDVFNGPQSIPLPSS